MYGTVCEKVNALKCMHGYWDYWVRYDTWARAARPLQQKGADSTVCARAQNTKATPLR